MNLSNINTNTLTKETQATLTADSSLELLKLGNQRFLENNPLNRDLLQQVGDTGKGQYPFAAILSCIDSRVSSEIIFDQGIGDIFSVRIAGNFINKDILGSLEFACKLAGSKVIVVLGHTSCGAVKGACDSAELGNLTQMLEKIIPAVNAVRTVEGANRSSQNIEFVNEVASKNVELSMEELRRQSPVLKELESNGEIVIVGAMYDVTNGKVSFN